MEVNLSNNTIPIWRESERAVKRSQFTAESVIPDTIEDVKSIVWCRGGLLLKGKEPGLHGCSVSGEAQASLLLLTETGAVESLRLQKPFEIPFEGGSQDAEALPQIIWLLSGLEARMLNPRKLSVTFEVSAQMRFFQRASIREALVEKAENKAGLHLLREEHDCLTLFAVKEKPFTLRQQFSPENCAGAPKTIAGEELRFSVSGVEQIGGRCIVKGELALLIWGMDESGLPSELSLSLPFSQLLEGGEEPLAETGIAIEPSAVYLDWSEGLDGQRSLDAEIHAVLQAALYTQKSVSLVSDAYSTRMPVTLQREEQCLLASLRRGSGVLRAEERIPVPGEVSELLSSQAILGPLEADREGSVLPLRLQMLCRDTDGRLDSVSKTLRLRGESLPEGAEIDRVSLNSCDMTLQDGSLLVSAEGKLDWERRSESRISSVTGVTLDEEKAWDLSQLPALSLVRREGESLWELAKEYRSSVEAISAYNSEDDKLLLIPAE